MKEAAKLKGLQEGKQGEKLELAKALLDILDNEMIAQKTKLPLDVVQDLRRKYMNMYGRVKLKLPDKLDKGIFEALDIGIR